MNDSNPKAAFYRDPRTPVAIGPTCSRSEPTIFARRGSVDYAITRASEASELGGFLIPNGYTVIPRIAFFNEIRREIQIWPAFDDDPDVYVSEGYGSPLKCERIDEGQENRRPDKRDPQ